MGRVYRTLLRSFVLFSAGEIVEERDRIQPAGYRGHRAGDFFGDMGEGQAGRGEGQGEDNGVAQHSGADKGIEFCVEEKRAALAARRALQDQ